MKSFEIPEIKITSFDADVVTTNSTGGGSSLSPGTNGVAGNVNMNMENTYNVSFTALW